LRRASGIDKSEESMLRLHGFASSNYYNIVKLVLIEKGLEFDELTSYPPADEAYAQS
jgi:glutathione S-transferase